MEAALRARLIAAATLAGSRIYWEDRPQAAALPAVLLSVISDNRDQHLQGFDMNSARVQVDVLALTYEDKKSLKEAVIAALAPAQLGNGIQFMRAVDISVVPRNERTETRFVFRDAIDFLFRWKTTA